MSSQAYTRGILRVQDGTIALATTACKVGLAKSAYSPNANESSLSTFASSEADCTGYTGGFGGGGRKAATVANGETAGTKTYSTIANLTWTALGGALNNTLRYAVLLREVTNDAASIPICFLQFGSDLTTNGSDVALSFDGTNGNLRFTV